jgi:serine/threonine protein phosphatase PrpC
MLCPTCNTEQPTGNRFCEDCGTRLTPEPPAPPPAVGPACPQCGAGPESVDPDGFCSRCGHERVAPARDHIEIAAAAHLAGVSDRGRKHHRNEDFFALASVADADALVVCDGVSSSQNADQASEAAANAAGAVLRNALTSRETAPGLLHAAVRAAQKAVTELPSTSGSSSDPPETTIVAALRRGRRLTVAWIGDSRAYLVTANSVRLLTRDHSWVNDVIAAGRMTLAEALQAPQAHALTRTLGGPEAVLDDRPEMVVLDLPESGWLVLCTDGLWNYITVPAQLAELVRASAPGHDALTIAQRLVRFACDRGGHDNITAAVLAF